MGSIWGCHCSEFIHRTQLSFLRSNVSASPLIDELFGHLDSLAPYPAGVVPVPSRIPGTAFFPGGHGLWRTSPTAPLPVAPVGGIMILGHNWGTETDHKAACLPGFERMSDPTFRGLNAILDGAGIDRAECFMTNVYMGLLTGTSNVGTFPADLPFRQRCLTFLRRQLASLQPRAILVLGGDALQALATLSPELQCWLHSTDKRRTFPEIDAAGQAIRLARFDGLDNPIPVAALTHPCNANRQHSPNQKWPRRYTGLTRVAAEIQMAREACKSAS